MEKELRQEGFLPTEVVFKHWGMPGCVAELCSSTSEHLSVPSLLRAWLLPHGVVDAGPGASVGRTREAQRVHDELGEGPWTDMPTSTTRNCLRANVRADPAGAGLPVPAGVQAGLPGTRSSASRPPQCGAGAGEPEKEMANNEGRGSVHRSQQWEAMQGFKAKEVGMGFGAKPVLPRTGRLVDRQRWREGDGRDTARAIR